MNLAVEIICYFRLRKMWCKSTERTPIVIKPRKTEGHFWLTVLLKVKFNEEDQIFL